MLYVCRRLLKTLADDAGVFCGLVVGELREREDRGLRDRGVGAWVAVLVICENLKGVLRRCLFLVRGGCVAVVFFSENLLAKVSRRSPYNIFVVLSWGFLVLIC